MLIPQGYKQTEMGIIPKDWKIISILNIAELLSGLTYLPENISEQGLLVLRSSNIKDGNLSFEDNVYVNCIIDKNKYVKKNDILICVRNGSSNLIGKCALVTKNYNATFGAFMAVLRSPIGKYLYQVFSSQIIQKQIQKNCKATINQITKADFKNFYIPISINIKEQQSISEALYDTDKLIFSMQNLIDKKKAIKQGVMQELLTGKRRLPGFNGKWVKKRLGDIVEINKGSTLTSSEYVYGNIPVMAGGKDYAGMHNTFNRPEMTITISASGANAGFIKIHSKKIFATDCSTIVPNKDYNIYYMYYNLLINQNVIYNLQTGGAQPHVHPKDLYSLYIEYSTDLKEQQAIANVLTDMDDEIKKLEIKLQKYKNIKQGMMQELLTGRIRLLD